MKKAPFVIILLFALLLAGCGSLPIGGGSTLPTSTPVVPVVMGSEGVIAEGNVAPRDSTWLYSRTGGQVAELAVKEGDTVEKNAVLLRFKDADNQDALNAALAAAQYEQTAAQQALDDLNKQAAVAASAAQTALAVADKDLVDAQQSLADMDTTQYQDDLDTLQKDVGTFKADLDDAQKEFDKVKDMDPTNSQRKTADDKLKDAQKKYDDAIRKRDLKVNDLDQAKAEVAAAQARRDDAQRVYNDRKNGTDPQQLALAQARLDNAKAQVKAAQTGVDGTPVLAPFAGTITQMQLAVGETVLPNQPVMQIADLSDLYIETNDLTEMEVVEIQEGQAALAVPDSMKDLTLPATVERIDRVSGKKGGDVTYTVRLKLDKADPRLRWGMTVQVTFNK